MLGGQAVAQGPRKTVGLPEQSKADSMAYRNYKVI